MNDQLFGTMTKKDFVKHYWNKKPVIFKNAIKNPSMGLDFAHFYDFAQSSESETRMVYESGGEYPWQAKEGPFKKSEFKNKGKWTLICHNLEHDNDELYQLKKNFNFISDWHADDVMATISEIGASVGAHIDDYSVFIIQGVGKRNWLLEENPIDEYFPELDIRLLKNFTPTIEWTLEPGDMIYIPPNVAHHGITLEKSISYSIGFKSIRYNNLLPYFAGDLCEELEHSSFLDTKTRIASDPFLVPDHVCNAIHTDLIKIISNSNLFEKSLMTFLASPRNTIENTNELNEYEIGRSLRKRRIYRDRWSKLVSRRISDSKYQIAINQSLYLLEKEHYEILKKVFLLPAEVGIQLTKQDLENENLEMIFTSLIQDGSFHF